MAPTRHPLKRQNLLLQGFFNRFAVDLAGKMDGAFPVHRVPARRIGKTVELRIEPYFPRRIVGSDADQPPGGLPRRPARCPAHDPHVRNDTALDLYFKLG